MSNKIDNTVIPTAATKPVQSVSRQDTAKGGVPQQQAPGRTDSFALTGEARVLQKLEQQVHEQSGVDLDKVAEMKRILSQGSFSADPQQIASQLMKLESALGGPQ